jgi:hypothetical protein
MQFIRVKRLVGAFAATLVVSGLAAGVALAQPGAPTVTVFPNNSVEVSYVPTGPPPPGTVLVATYNGQPAGSFPIGTATTVFSGAPIPAGSYTVLVSWGNGVESPVTPFVVPGGGPAPGPTTMQGPIIVGNTVTLRWDPSLNATEYELEVVVFDSGFTFIHPVELNTTTLTFTGVPFGNYLVRVRGRNASGVVGPYSNQVLVSVGVAFRVRDMEVTLTWNTLSDIDLHVIEPDGTHVFWDSPMGVTARLDRDDTTGFGPETISVGQGAAAPGVYQVFVVHYRGEAPTTSTIAITLDVGTPNAQTEVFTRTTEEADPETAVNVALVDLRNRLIGGVSAIRDVDKLVAGLGMRRKAQ